MTFLIILALILPNNVDAYYLSRCIQGEMSLLFPEDQEELGRWIGHTIRNRVESPWFPNDIPAVVEDGCHGYVNTQTPDEWAIFLALRVLSEEDITGGALFFLGGHDLRANDWSFEESVRDFYGARGFSFHFFEEWVE